MKIIIWILLIFTAPIAFSQTDQLQLNLKDILFAGCNGTIRYIEMNDQSQFGVIPLKIEHEIQHDSNGNITTRVFPMKPAYRSKYCTDKGGFRLDHNYNCPPGQSAHMFRFGNYLDRLFNYPYSPEINNLPNITLGQEYVFERQGKYTYKYRVTKVEDSKLELVIDGNETYTPTKWQKEKELFVMRLICPPADKIKKAL